VVEVVRGAAEGIEFLALCEEGGGVEVGASLGEGLVADGGVFRGDEGEEHNRKLLSYVLA
jgi:hypothetical protein